MLYEDYQHISGHCAVYAGMSWSCVRCLLSAFDALSLLVG